PRRGTAAWPSRADVSGQELQRGEDARVIGRPQAVRRAVGRLIAGRRDLPRVGAPTHQHKGDALVEEAHWIEQASARPHRAPARCGSRSTQAAAKPAARSPAYVAVPVLSTRELQSQTRITGSVVAAGPLTSSEPCASWRKSASPSGCRWVVTKRNSTPRTSTSAASQPRRS